MNYITHYNALIDRAKDRYLDVYTESHHIIPKCMLGTDNKDNLVELTPEEHYLAHQLLVKIYPANHKLVYAVTMMCVSSKSHNGKRLNNKLYGWIKRRLSRVASINGTGTGGSQFGTCWIHSIEQKASKKIHKVELEKYLETDWKAGRIMKFDKPKKINKRELLKQETDIRYLDALNRSNSISDALRFLGLKTAGAGYARMKRVVEKYNLKDKFSHEYIKWE